MQSAFMNIWFFFKNGSSKEFTEFQVQLQDVIVITSYFIKFLFS